jgi:hypothetical protein
MSLNKANSDFPHNVFILGIYGLCFFEIGYGIKSASNEQQATD